MPVRNKDLHGNVPDSSPVALVLIDVINDLEFDSGAELLRHALPMAARLASLKRRAKYAGIPVIYVNDNFGKWRSDLRQQLRHCLDDDVRGRPVVELLAPEEDDYFVLKPKHSGFFHTSLDLLLQYLEVETLIIAGIATDACVLATAVDAHMRDVRVIVPADCSAAPTAARHRQAIAHIERVLGAETTRSSGLRLGALVRGGRPRGRAGGRAPRRKGKGRGT